MPASVRVLSAFAVAALIAGCNEGASVGGNDADPHAPDRYAVRGAATFEGEPVDGTVSFTPIDGGEAITAPVENGGYELDAPQGKYKVTITGKAGDTELPAGLAVERAVGPDTTGQSVNIALPEADPEGREGSTPEEVRELGSSDPSAE